MIGQELHHNHIMTLKLCRLSKSDIIDNQSNGRNSGIVHSHDEGIFNTNIVHHLYTSHMNKSFNKRKHLNIIKLYIKATKTLKLVKK